MGRPSININKQTLTEIIQQCEKSQTYKNHSQLFKDVAQKYATLMKTPITPALIYLRVNEWEIPVTTPKGRKGRQKGEAIPSGVRKARGTKFAESDIARQSLALLKQEVKSEQNGRFLPIYNKLQNGSMQAAIKLKCLDCTNYQTEEIKHCPCTSCSLFLFRPYQSGSLSLVAAT